MNKYSFTRGAGFRSCTTSPPTPNHEYQIKLAPSQSLFYTLKSGRIQVVPMSVDPVAMARKDIKYVDNHRLQPSYHKV
jgi:hypothetical protein